MCARPDVTVGEGADAGRRVGDAARGRLRILLVGPLPPPIGGASRLFSYLATDLEQDGSCELEVVNIARDSADNHFVCNLWVAVRTALKIIASGHRADIISFHANMRGRTQFGPVVYLLSRLLGKPLVVRAFGGAFDRQFESLRPFHRRLLLRTYFRAEACLLETRNLVEYFARRIDGRVVWFPNCTRPARLRSPGGSCRRFVFLGRVTVDKGLEVILSAAESLVPGVSIDIFGPIEDRYTESSLAERGKGRVRYCGVLDEAGVNTGLEAYDAVVLPTFHTGEGYPGVVLEAYAHGIPVITTRWLSIPEIVDSSCGILIEPHSVEAFAEAVNRLAADDALFSRLCEGSRAKAREFSDRERTEQFLTLCRELVTARQARAGLGADQGS